MLVTLITPTGNRPEAFATCEKLIAKQNFKGGLQWIVVDDGSPATKCTQNQEYYTAPRPWQPELNTQRFNLEFALPKVKGDYIFVIEDDDHYHYNYIEQMLRLLQFAEIVGEGNSFYYHLQMKGWKEMQNTKHSALSQTAFHKSVLPIFKQAVDSGQFYIDLELWKLALVQKKRAIVFSNSKLSTGIKGFPGRANLSAVAQRKDYLYDPLGKKLQDRIGADFALYEKYIKPIRSTVDEKEKSNGQKVQKENLKTQARTAP